ncbi:MAG: DNA phosphorothioation system sulfurtransferase DndC, partial [Proteobacteria bacterium]|nr:DNA phosphorothioation system sulfurtransferase DndC [Pseudomonadota bacterium]
MKRINHIIDELIDQYIIEDNNRPWIIGFSGGKDSTVMLILVWLSMLKVKNNINEKYLRREIWVVSNDTMVENPVVSQYVSKILLQIQESAIKHNLPIKVKKTMPRLEDSFWVNLIGKGYPTPNNTFRWCTERLKIKPTSRFIDELISHNQEAIILVGTRMDESVSRAKSIKNHEIKGKRLTKHPLQKNVFVYSPIKYLMLEEVWYIINAIKPPWGKDNKELFDMYSDASADDYECPTMIASNSHKSCGQSRFGCWTCTVVQKDKSISAQIDNGKLWLAPLRDLRDWIQEQRNNPVNRSNFRRNGAPAVRPNGGVVRLKHRAEILERVFMAQKEINDFGHKIELIT